MLKILPFDFAASMNDKLICHDGGLYPYVVKSHGDTSIPLTRALRHLERELNRHCR